MLKNILSWIIVFTITQSTFAIVEFGGGAGYTYFQSTDTGSGKYKLKESNYSGIIYHGFGNVNFPVSPTVRLGLGCAIGAGVGGIIDWLF